ncbi:MAG TPA: DUF4349 domain-containing protein [Gemmatimonadales bacterium]|nr:DUF4349 domain-containing protein [Gemmatimonadales bacterium]
MRVRAIVGIVGVLLVGLVVVMLVGPRAAVRGAEEFNETRLALQRADKEVAGSVGAEAVASPVTPADATGYTALAYLPVRTPADAMIIRTGTASIAIDSLEPSIARVRDLAARVGGYLANSDIRAIQGGIRSASLEVRVPSARFDELVTGLSPLGKVEQVSVSAQDVGEEFTDISARVANGRRLEQRLIELIATRTGKLSDVLEIERELARVREEIERMEGRLRYLQAHAAVSSLSIQIHEPGPVVGDQGSLAVLAEAFRQAWRNSVRFAATGIAALGTLVPLGLLTLGAALGLRTAWRRRAA